MDLEMIFSRAEIGKIVDDTLLLEYHEAEKEVLRRHGHQRVRPTVFWPETIDLLGSNLDYINRTDPSPSGSWSIPQPSGSTGPPPPPYWESLKDEFRIFLCTDDKKYANLRKEIKNRGGESQLALCSMIAAAMAGYIGVAAGVLVPFCALCVMAALKVGTQAFCRATKLDMSIKE